MHFYYVHYDFMKDLCQSKEGKKTLPLWFYFVYLKLQEIHKKKY